MVALVALAVGHNDKGSMSMQLDYQKILNDHGFDSVPEAEETTLAFYHEINNSLFDDDSPFESKKSDVHELPNLLGSMVQCSLPLKSDKTLLDGVQYLTGKWYSDLCYQNPKFENIQRSNSAFGTEVRIFTITEKTACSFLFTITDEAAEQFSNEFMDSYGGVDNPEQVLKHLQRNKGNK